MSVADRASRLSVRPRAVPRVRLRSAVTVLLVAGICAIPVALYAPFFNEPFARDEGFYAAATQGMLHGQVPYRDFFDNKPPLIYGWYALSFLLFGETVWAPRVLVSLLISLATLCIYFNGRMIYSHRGGVVAATAFALSIGITKFEINANTEFFMLLPMTAGLLAYNKARQTDNGWLYLAAGVAGGVTILTKTIYVLPMVFLFCFAVWTSRRKGDRYAILTPSAWGRPALMIVGSLLALAVVSVPIILAGAFGDMVEALTYYSFIYSGDAPLAGRVLALTFSPLFIALVAGPWLLVAILGAVVMLRGEQRQAGILLSGWYIAGLVSIFVVGRYYTHYYAAVLPAMALLIPPGFDWVAERWRTRLGNFLVLVVLPLSLMTPLSFSINTYMQPDPAARHDAKFGLDRETSWEFQSLALGQWLKDHTSPGDYIYDFGFESQIYFYADRTSPTRFYFDHAFGLDEKYEREAIAELSENPPLYVVDSARYEGASAINYYSYPVHKWVVQNYDYVGKIYFADIWRLKGAVE